MQGRAGQDAAGARLTGDVRRPLDALPVRRGPDHDPADPDRRERPGDDRAGGADAFERDEGGRAHAAAGRAAAARCHHRDGAGDLVERHVGPQPVPRRLEPPGASVEETECGVDPDVAQDRVVGRRADVQGHGQVRRGSPQLVAPCQRPARGIRGRGIDLEHAPIRCHLLEDRARVARDEADLPGVLVREAAERARPLGSARDERDVDHHLDGIARGASRPHATGRARPRVELHAQIAELRG